MIRTIAESINNSDCLKIIHGILAGEIIFREGFVNQILQKTNNDYSVKFCNDYFTLHTKSVEAQLKYHSSDSNSVTFEIVAIKPFYCEWLFGFANKKSQFFSYTKHGKKKLATINYAQINSPEYDWARHATIDNVQFSDHKAHIKFQHNQRHLSAIQHGLNTVFGARQT